MRVADVAVAPLLQPQHEALGAGERDAGEHAVEAGPAQVEVVHARPVADDEAVSRPGLQCRDLLAAAGQADREAGPDRAVDGLRRGGRAATRRGERCGDDQAHQQGLCAVDPAHPLTSSLVARCRAWNRTIRWSEAGTAVRTVETPRTFGLRRDVVVEMEDVLGVVAPLDLAQTLVVRAVGRSDGVLSLVVAEVVEPATGGEMRPQRGE